jgi:antitoxin PrlF
MSSAKLTSKGQITIPLEVRRALRLRTGDRLAFRVRDDRTVMVTPERGSLDSLRGMLKPRVRGVSIAEMNETIRRRGAGRK